MINKYQIEILNVTASGFCSISDLVSTLNYAPLTITNNVRLLIDQGFAEEAPTKKYGGGRAPKIIIPTEDGKKILELESKAEFKLLSKRFGKVLAGPILTLSKLGIDLLGRQDLFSKYPLETKLFDIETAEDFIFESPHEDKDYSFPNIDSFVIWLIDSKNPRFIAIVPLILKKITDLRHIKFLAITRGSINRLNFLLELANKADQIEIDLQIPGKTEKMLDFENSNIDEITEIARKYGVENVPSKSSFEEAKNDYEEKVVIY